MKNNNQLQVGVILLAAGESKRFGSAKQLLDIKGQPMIKRMALAAFKSEATEVMVVLGAQVEDIKAVLNDPGLEITINQDWQKGLGSSLKTGLKAILKKQPELEACIVMLADQPLVDTSYLNHMIRMYKEHKEKIIASSYADTIGAPVLYHQDMFRDLLNLKDDQGAKNLLENKLNEVYTIAFPGGQADIDTQEDYQNIKDKLS